MNRHLDPINVVSQIVSKFTSVDIAYRSNFHRSQFFKHQSKNSDIN